MAHLHINRIRTIMKTTEGTDSINKDAVFVVKEATEHFIKELTREAFKDMNGAKKLNYSNLVNVVHNNNRYEFLEYMIPNKITVREFKEILRKKGEVIEISDDGESIEENEEMKEEYPEASKQLVIIEDSLPDDAKCDCASFAN